MTFRRIIFAAFSASAGLLLFHCANHAGGWGIGMGGEDNRVRSIQWKRSSGREGARVVLCPERFLKDTSVTQGGAYTQELRETVTDKSGFFIFNRVKPGRFHIEVNDDKNYGCLSECEVSGSDAGGPITCVLKPAGRISGRVVFPSEYRGSAYVQIYGLDRIARTASNGTFAFTDIPEGTYMLHILPTFPEYLPKDVDPAVVASGAETGLGSLAVALNSGLWSHKRRLYLNTTATGANVAGDVTDFPFLIRLDSENFDFSQAQVSGADVRFTKYDNTFLPYEIERWDAGSQHAEIWVKVDTVRGNNGTQSLMMYWGNGNTSSQSNGPSVFDTSNGFQGVWHLNEMSGTHAVDATYNGFTGTYRGGLPAGENCPLGISQNITRPDSDYIDMGNVLNPGMKNISIGVWVNRSSFVTPQALIAKTKGDLPSAAYGYLLSIDPVHALHFNMASGGARWGDDGTFEVASNLAITDSTSWHYLFVSIDRSDNYRCSMYIDGIDRTGTIRGNVAGVADIANALNLHIGTENDCNCSFTGAISEVNISFTTRSADWVKLSYMNQKEQDALVKW